MVLSNSEPASVLPSADTEHVRLSWTAPRGLLGLSLYNFMLRILTLGIHHFWGRAEVRRRIWSGVRINGEPLEYTGTGFELFRGFVTVFFLVFVPITLSSAAIVFAFGPKSTVTSLLQWSLTFLTWFLIGLGYHRSQRYRLSRTRWRGIGFSLTGSSWAYAHASFWSWFLIPLSVGWCSPWRTTMLQRNITPHMRFGDRALTFEARDGPLYPSFAVLWFAGLIIMIGLVFLWGAGWSALGLGRYVNRQPPSDVVFLTVVGLYGGLLMGWLFYTAVSAWYRAKMFNHFAAYTAFEGVRFRGTMTGRGLMWNKVSNLLISVLSFGILIPISQARTMRYMVEHLEFDGDVPLAAILPGGAAQPGRGEGLAQVFDVDAF